MTIYLNRPTEPKPEKPVQEIDPEKVEQINNECVRMRDYLKETLEEMKENNQTQTISCQKLHQKLNAVCHDLNSLIDVSAVIAQRLYKRGQYK